MTKAHILFVLAVLIIGLTIPPACAATSIVTTGYFPDAIKEIETEGVTDFTFSVNSTRAISNVQFRAPKGTEINYTITYGTDNSLDGFITYLPGDIDIFGFGQGVTTINIGSSTDSRSYVDTGLTRKWEIVGYAREQDDNGTVLSTGYAVYDVSLGVGNIGLQSGFIAYQSVGDLQPIESITFTSNQPVWLYIGTAERSEIQTGISKTATETFNEWVQFAVGIASSVLGFVVMLLGIIKFFFIDNLLLVIALWISVTMAFSAISTRNIFQFYQKFFRYQRALLDFIVQLWNYLVQIISSFRGIFRI
jgi:hypothetical protein